MESIDFRAKEEEIERKKMEIRDKVQAQLGVLKEVESLAAADPTRKDIGIVRKKMDAVNKKSKPLSILVRKKEKEYREALDAFVENQKEKERLLSKMKELVGESQRFRMQKLDELSHSTH